MKILGQSEALETLRANATPRMLALGKLRRYVTGDQYEGRKSWYDSDVPVWDRAPVVIWAGVESAIASNEDFLLGDGRYPAVTACQSEENGDEDEALDEDSSRALDAFLKHAEREAKLREHNRAAYFDAQSVGTCIGLFGARNGRLFAETIQAEYSTPEFDEHGTLIKLTIQYPFLDLIRLPSGEYQQTCKIFRRVIDTTRDVTYEPAVAKRNGDEPIFSEDRARSVTHGFGFCPVIWHKFRVTSSIVNETDGRAIHAGSLDELDAYNLQASIRHDGAIYSLPQRYEIGVTPGYNPTETAKSNLIIYGQPGGGNFASHSPPSERFTAVRNPGAATARKAGPKFMWQYDDPNTKVGQLEVSEGALESLANTMSDLRARICEQLAWIALNPEEIKFAAALSGKALERIMARQINRVAKDRDGFGQQYILAVYSMILRIASILGPTQLKTRGIAKAFPAVKTFSETSDDWNDPPLTLRWGAWFAPVPEDEERQIKMVIEAKNAKLITDMTALEKISRIFGIEDVGAYHESLEEENEKRVANEMGELENGLASLHQKLNGNPKPGTGRGNASSSPQDGSRDSGTDANPKASNPVARSKRKTR